MKNVESKSSKVGIIALSLVLAVISVLAIIFAARGLFRREARSLLSQEAYTKRLEFNSNLQGEIKLAVKLATSPLVIDYMQHPDDERLSELAMREFLSYRDSFISNTVFWIGDTDLKYYSNGDCLYVLDRSDPDSAWYSDTLKTNEKYLFNINFDKGIKKTYLWINVPVRTDSGKVVGITGTGIPLGEFVDSMYSNLKPQYTMYLFNEKLEVTGSKNISDLENAVPISSVMPIAANFSVAFPKSETFISSVGECVIIPLDNVEWDLLLFYPYSFLGFLKNSAIPFVLFFIVFIAFGATVAILRLIQPLEAFNATVNSITRGDADLSQRITLREGWTFAIVGTLVRSVNEFLQKLQTIISEVKDSKSQLVGHGNQLRDCMVHTSSAITQINSNIQSMSRNIMVQADSVSETVGAVNQISTHIDSLNKMISSQSTGVTEASAAVTQMISNISAVTSSVSKLSSSFEHLEDLASDGTRKQEDVNTRIMQIQQQSELLQDANQIISSIAEQTNLLAMNAAIEAAHAGEAGRGFSVVADEIRKLSETSSAQSKTIGDELKEIQESISGIVGVSKESMEVFSSVAEGIHVTSGLTSQIIDAMHEQEEGSVQIRGALKIMNDSTSEVTYASSEMAAGNQTILSEIKHLQNATDSMKAGMEEMSAGTKLINETGASLSDISTSLEESIKQIGGQIDTFRI